MKRILSFIAISLSFFMANPMVSIKTVEAEQVIGTKIPCIYSRARLGEAQLYHNSEGFWVEYGNEFKQIHPGFVDKLIRNMSTEQLSIFLGLDKPEVTLITQESFEENYSDCGFDAYEISEADKDMLISHFGSGYLRLDQMSDGEFSLKAFSGGLGGGPITGVVVGATVKVAGYATIALCGGPIGWGVVAVGLGSTALSGCISGIFSWVGKTDKLTKAGYRAAKTAKKLDKAQKMLAGAQKIAQKAPTAKNLKNAAELTAKVQKLTIASEQAASKLSSMAALNRVAPLATGKDALEVAVTTKETADAVKAAKVATNAAKAAFVPTVALVDGVADVAQFICDFLPTP